MRKLFIRKGLHVPEWSGTRLGQAGTAIQAGHALSLNERRYGLVGRYRDRPLSRRRSAAAASYRNVSSQPAGASACGCRLCEMHRTGPSGRYRSRPGTLFRRYRQRKNRVVFEKPGGFVVIHQDRVRTDLFRIGDSTGLVGTFEFETLWQLDLDIIMFGPGEGKVDAVAPGRKRRTRSLNLIRKLRAARTISCQSFGRIRAPLFCKCRSGPWSRRSYSRR